MWRKPVEPKPSSQASNAPESAPVKEPTAEQAKPTDAPSNSTPASQSAPATSVSVSATASAVPVSSKTSESLATPTPSPATPVEPSSAGVAASKPAPIPREVPAESRSSSTIKAGLKIRGEILGDTDLFVDGEVKGKIRMTNARVTVGPNGRVQADIEAREIIIEGTLEGGLTATEFVRLGDASRVQGSVLSPNIAIADGARFRGNVEMVRQAAGAATATTTAGGAPGDATSKQSKDREAARAASASGDGE